MAADQDSSTRERNASIIDHTCAAVMDHLSDAVEAAMAIGAQSEIVEVSESISRLQARAGAVLREGMH